MGYWGYNPIGVITPLITGRGPPRTRGCQLLPVYYKQLPCLSFVLCFFLSFFFNSCLSFLGIISWDYYLWDHNKPLFLGSFWTNRIFMDLFMSRVLLPLLAGPAHLRWWGKHKQGHGGIGAFCYKPCLGKDGNPRQEATKKHDICFWRSNLWNMW